MSENASQKQREHTNKELVAGDKTDKAAEETPMEQTTEIGKKLDEAGLNQEQKEVALRAISAEEVYSGPIPHPRIMGEYEKVLPGSADRIITMAENEAKHRHAIDDKCVKTDARDSLLGIIGAIVLGMTCVISGVVVIIKVPEISGTIAGLIITGGGLAGILGTFLKGTKATWKIEK